MNRRLKSQGIALVTVLVIAVISISVLAVLNTSVFNELRSGGASKVRNELSQAADGLSDQARLAMVLGFQDQTAQSAWQYANARLNQASAAQDMGGGVEGRWKVAGVSAQAEPNVWVDIHATATRNGQSQTVIRRITFKPGSSKLFELAMLAEKTDCMYCHLTVNGDVGSIMHLRPGWGDESNYTGTYDCYSDPWIDDPCMSGWGSGRDAKGSKVNGNVYAARTITDDDTDLGGPPKRINGVQVTGNIESNSSSPKLSLEADADGDGVGEFPPIRRDSSIVNSKGTMTGGTIVGVARGSALTALPSGSNVTGGVNGVYDGNLVLIGTPENPIVLEGDIYVKGDVVIKGVVTGRGAIYADRNMYMAGSVTTANPADRPGSGACAGISDPDACARANITAGKDELRLAARGTTVLGDYTEREGDGTTLRPADRTQSADFYRYQFGLASGQRCYDRDTSDELKLNASNNTYVNVEGTVIPDSRVVCRNANKSDPDDAYTYSFKPGSIASDGSFRGWLSDEVYRNALLGEREYTNMTWRTDRWGRFDGETNEAYYARIRPQMIAARMPEAVATQIACAMVGAITADCPTEIDKSGAITGWGAYNVNDQWQARFMVDQALWDTQVTRVDAFLYSNMRIAGRTTMNALAINGGMIGKEIGILAPGRQRFFWMPDEIPCTDPYKDVGAENCGFNINYDHRLRNGGYGFNNVKAQLGQTIAWKLSDNAGDKVNP